jgi:hypothetical protein
VLLLNWQSVSSKYVLIVSVLKQTDETQAELAAAGIYISPHCEEWGMSCGECVKASDCRRHYEAVNDAIN